MNRNEAIGDTARAGRKSAKELLRYSAVGVVAAVVVGAIDWGGVDRGGVARAMAGLWTFLASQSLVTAHLSRRQNAPWMSVRGDLYGAAGTACMIPGQLVSNDPIAGTFLVAAFAFIAANLIVASRVRRAAKAAAFKADGAASARGANR